MPVELFTHTFMKFKIFTFLFLLAQFSFAQTPDCIPGWGFARTVKVFNPGQELLTDFQVVFELDTRALVDSGKLRTDGADLRVTDENCQALFFYGEKFDVDSANQIWVKLPSIMANDSVKLYVYYGNDTAQSTINGDSTFIFFDDFGTETVAEVDSNKWEAIGEFSEFKISNGRLEYASTGSSQGSRFKFTRSKATFSEQVVFDFNAQISNSNGFGFSSTDSTLDRIIFRQSGFGFDTMNQVAFNDDTVTNGTSVSQEYPFIRFVRNAPTNATMTAGIQGDTLTITDFRNLDENSFAADTFQLTRSPMSSFHFILSTFSGFNIFLDYLRVRKPAAVAPTSTVGAEEMFMIPNSILPTAEWELKLYPNPASETVSLEGLPTGAYDLMLVDHLGRKLWTDALHVTIGTTQTLELPSLPTGTYHLWMTNGQESMAHSLMIRQK
ncbi:MAG: DUF2341 domain-containing protein [Bacteroidota bacterium]